jgi:peptidoglycan/LPS O-acetylase OafA/YrhL
MIRSALAVLAGILVLTVVSFAIEAVANPFLIQNVPARMFTLAYTMLCVSAGGYVTAWLARSSEVKHAVIMGVIEAVFTVGAMLALPGHAPLWSWVAGIVLITPAAWVGGMLRANRSRNEARRRPS